MGCLCLINRTSLGYRKKNIELEAKRPGLKFWICHYHVGQVTKTFSASDFYLNQERVMVSGLLEIMFEEMFLKVQSV